MSDSRVIKEFTKKDVFYNNGLVNLKMYLDEYSVKGLEYELTENNLNLKYPELEDEKYYNEILNGFITNNHIVFHTDNDRLYWDKDNGGFIYSKKYDVQGKSSGNDVKNLYKYVTPTEIGKTTEKLFNEYMEFAKKNGLKDASIKEDRKIFEKASKFKPENQCKIPLFMTPNEAVKSYIEYSVKGDMLNLDSKIHQFEDGGYCFRDMLLNKDNYIDKWDALIYWYGVKTKRYYNSVYFIYLNSTDLLALYDLKKHFNISDEIEKYRDKKTGKVKNSSTNVKMSSQLEHDGIENNNFYISSSISEFQLKFFMYMLSHIYHIEDDYETSDRERIRRRVEKLYNNLLKISFVTYTEDGNMKSSLDEYTKTYRVIGFLKKLIEMKYDDSTLFKYFADLITSISLSKSDQEKVNLNIKKFCESILKFSDLRKIYYEVSFKILRNNKRSLGSGLYEFENIYLKEIRRGEYIMSLHTKSKELGREIGVFAANLNDKDLLFKLRNIKNQKQMVSYFKDLKFTVLRKQADAKFSKEFNNTMEEILTEIEEKPADWEIIRDYIAIYAIDKYRAAVYAKQTSKGGK
ncbi:hypothetical protein [Clostridium coskatii]|uniref:CRISPR-associated protein Csh1 n=1 Tax=Clostridium coskatii TaxID=1705578 RepID=A0A166SP21_9CLOT|nr:hypothetical protein [Clostridium coskatii]OAA92593.1 hypothetical protein WX73_00889 [Clostridium coskatii]OBR91522.1 hypothetical protein CLCOS_34420 [Clostridium coskatii]